MEIQVLDKISEQIKENKKAALITITKVEGSTPRKEGSMMAVFEDGTTYGTIGGGNLEAVAVQNAIKCLEGDKSQGFQFELNDDEGSLHMQCGGIADVFIKVFIPKSKLVIVGGGHIALELYQLGKLLGFYTVIFEDREEFLNRERFPEANELILGNIEKKLMEYNIDDHCSIVIITRGHSHDEVALKTVINSDAGYIGMIGSKNKTQYVMDRMRERGVSEEKIKTIYAPIGLDLGGETPMDIAFSIMAEIMLVKNKRKLKHMRERMAE